MSVPLVMLSARRHVYVVSIRSEYLSGPQSLSVSDLT